MRQISLSFIIIITLLITLVCFYYFYDFENQAWFQSSASLISLKKANNNKKFDESKNIIWPEHLRMILKYSQELQHILLDSRGLECIYGDGDSSKKGCNALFADNVIRLGSIINDFVKLKQIVDSVLIKESFGVLTIETFLPKENFDTIIINYRSPKNFIKYIILTIIELPPKDKNFHLLRGGNYASTIGIRTFKTASYELVEFKTTILVPNDIARYLFFYERGHFLECNRTLASRIPKNTKYVITKEAVKPLSQLIDDIMKTGQTPFMAFGTLLGWYRDCGFIPFTTDVDFYIMADEYVEDFERAFIKHPITPVTRRIGKKEYGLEFSFNVHHNIPGYRPMSTDFFFVYENNETAQWAPLMTNVAKLERAKCVIPRITGLCSGELYGHLFFLPCNYLPIIEASYGIKWATPDKNAGIYDEGMQIIPDGKWNAKLKELYVTF